jgi:hypothetical protein
VGTVEAHVEDEAADEGFVEVCWMPLGVAAGCHRFDHQLGQPLQVFCGGGLNWFLHRLGFGVADEFVEADGGGLAEVHGGVAHSLGLVHGDGEERLAVAELFVAEAGLFGAEEQCDPRERLRGSESGARQLRTKQGAGFGEGMKRMLLAAQADGGGAYDERAIGDRLGDAGVFAGGFEDRGGVYGRAGAFERDGVFVDEAESYMARATAPMLLGSRARTSTTQSRSSSSWLSTLSF